METKEIELSKMYLYLCPEERVRYKNKYVAVRQSSFSFEHENPDMSVLFSDEKLPDLYNEIFQSRVGLINLYVFFVPPPAEEYPHHLFKK